MENSKTFLVEVGRYINKERKLDFPTYTAYIGKQQKRINLKFRKDVKELPEETCYIKVLDKDMSIDTSKRYPALWVHKITEVIPYEKHNETAVAKFFGELEEGKLPF